MGIKRFRPYTPSRRNMTVSTFEEITKKTPEKSLLATKKKNAGRNAQGKITVRHQGGAHEGALYAASTEASTAAVLGTGIDVPYPERNRKLYDAVREKGVLLSDYPLHTKPQPSNFPRRNRIISGMASGLVVIEAALRSGSLITANKALEQGRDVFAVPANPLDPRAQGVNHLIKTGAPLVESAQDVLEHLGAFQAVRILHSAFILP